jgi:hypothetical protein
VPIDCQHEAHRTYPCIGYGVRAVDLCQQCGAWREFRVVADEPEAWRTPQALGEMEMQRDEWQAKAEAFGQKAYQLQQKIDELNASFKQFMIDVLQNPKAAAKTLGEALRAVEANDVGNR